MATIPANNNTGLYNTSGTAATTGNDITVTGNVNANNINAVNTVNAGTSVNAGTDVSAAGNVVAGQYFIGDGSLLTNINAGNIVGSYGNANVASYLASGTNTSNVITTGNISGTYILGNGSQLTGLPATYGNANVDAHLAAFGSNTIVTTGNITGGYFIGNGSQLTGLPAQYGNANVAAFLPTYTGNLAGGNAHITNDLTVDGTIYGTFSGNISGNLVVPGANTEVIYNNSGNAGASSDFTFNNSTKVLAVNGNVNATQFNGSGAGLSDLAGGNVVGYVSAAYYADHALVADNAAYVTGNSQPDITSLGTLTSLSVAGNVNVGGSLNTDDVTSTGNITVYGNQVITGNLTVQGTTTTINSNTITTNDKTITVANNQSTGANVDGAGLEAGNPAVATWLYNDATQTWKSSIGVSAVGNITGSYILGNGSQLTGLPATYSNAQVAAYLASGTNSSNIITTGNISGSYIIGNGSQLTGLPAGYSNAQVASYLSTYSGNIGNATSDLKLTGNSIGLYGQNGSPSIYLTNSGADTFITTPGATRVSLPGANFQGDTVSVEFTYDTSLTGAGLAVNGNLFGTGNSITTTGNIATLGIKTDGYYYANGTPLSFGGTYGDSNVTTLLASLGSNVISSTGNITTTANISGGYILGNGSQLTGLPASYGNSNVTTLLSAFGSNTISTTGNVTAGYVIGNGSALTSLTGANVTGTVANATYATSAGSATSATTAGTATYVTANAQANITSVGTLSSLAVSGNTTSGNISITGTVVAGGNISGNYILGNGSQLTGIVASSSYGNANVAAFMAAFGSNTISTTGTIVSGTIYPANVGSVGSRVPVGWFDALAASTSIVSSGTLDAGSATITGNISAAYFNGNGRGLTGLSTYGNSNVALFLNNLGSNSINTTSGNITGANLNATAGVYTNTLEATGNIDGVNLNLSGGIYAPQSSINIGDINTDGNIILNGAAGSGTSGANIDYINGGGYARFYGNVTSVAGYLKSGTIAYTNADGTAGQALLTYGNGMTYFGTVAGSYGDSNVNTHLAAFGSNTISTTGNITGGYFIGNGSQLTGITTSYGDTNVVSLLSSFGSNTISTTGNITGGNVIGTTSLRTQDIYVTGTVHTDNLSSDPGSYVNIDGVNTGLVYITDRGNLFLYESASSGTNYTGFRAPATLAADYLYTLPTSFGSSSQFLQTDGAGNLTWATAGGGGGSPGGSNTQIQFNDSSSFAGNANMTFDKTTGNIGLGNLILNTQSILTTQASNVGLTSSTTPNPGRITIGNGYNGNLSPVYDLNNIGRGARLMIADSIGITDGNSLYRGLGIQNYYTLNANVSSNNCRLQAINAQMLVGGGAAGNTYSATSSLGLSGAIFAVNLGGGTSGNLTGVGNIVAQGATGVATNLAIQAGSTLGNAFGLTSSLTNNGTGNTLIGAALSFAGTGTFGNVYGIYMPNSTGTYTSFSSSTNARSATNYYFLYNDDDVAKNKMGMLAQYQEFEYGLSSSGGAVTVNKANGQVQFYTVSEDATMSFSNFVTSATVSATTRYQTDTVTVIVQQDATGRTITMPSGATYKYAGGTNTITTTANSVSMISITAVYNTVAAATQYLITISPEFI